MLEKKLALSVRIEKDLTLHYLKFVSQLLRQHNVE